MTTIDRQICSHEYNSSQIPEVPCLESQQVARTLILNVMQGERSCYQTVELEYFWTSWMTSAVIVCMETSCERWNSERRRLTRVECSWRCWRALTGPYLECDSQQYVVEARIYAPIHVMTCVLNISEQCGRERGCITAKILQCLAWSVLGWLAGTRPNKTSTCFAI